MSDTAIQEFAAVMTQAGVKPNPSYCLHPHVEGTSDYQCECHERMGNDFWFLPIDSCLYESRS